MQRQAGEINFARCIEAGIGEKQTQEAFRTEDETGGDV